MENVLIGDEDALAARVVTRLESSPPDRNVPHGTSRGIRLRTAASSMARSCSDACCLDWGPCDGAGTDQYRSAQTCPSVPSTMKWAGGSFRMPRKIERGDGTYSCVRYRESAVQSSSRETARW